MSEILLAQRIVEQAIRDWRAVTTTGADKWLYYCAQDLRYAGARDEVLSAMHSEWFGELVENLGLDIEVLLRKVGAHRHGCYCTACTGTDALAFLPSPSANPYVAAARVALGRY